MHELNGTLMTLIGRIYADKKIMPRTRLPLLGLRFGGQVHEFGGTLMTGIKWNDADK